MNQLTQFELRDIERAWQEGAYVNYADRDAVLDLAAIGAVVHQLARSDTPIAHELRRVIELAKTNRRTLA